MCDTTQGSLWLSPMKIHQKYVDTVTFFKNLNQRLLTPRWPLTSCLLRSHVWFYSRIIVSKSHGNTAMHVDTSDQFCKIPHTYLHTYYTQLVHTTYRMSDHIVSFWTRSGETKMTYNYYFLGLFSPPPPNIFSHLYAKPCQILNPVIRNFACILITQVTCQRWFWITSYYLCTGSTGWQHVGLHLKVMKQIKLVSYIFILT